jgi:hypothetical protein
MVRCRIREIPEIQTLDILNPNLVGVSGWVMVGVNVKIRIRMTWIRFRLASGLDFNGLDFDREPNGMVH